MSGTYPTSNIVFGNVKMHENIADVSDLALLLKANEEYSIGGIVTASLPEGADLVLNTVIQLTEKVEGHDGDGNEFAAGHYYQYTDSKGTPAWYDITEGVNRVKHTGYGYFYKIDDTHVKCVWTDPVNDEDENGWNGSELYCVYEDNGGAEQYELLYTETSDRFYEVAIKDGVVIELSDDLDLNKCAFVVRYKFEDTTSYSSIALAPITSIELSNANRFRSEVKALLGCQTDKLIVKDNTFTDCPASVHVFSNGIFSGPDGLMLPTDKNASGGENYHGIFFRQKNSSNEWVYSNNSMTSASFNLPIYDRINDKYILSGTGGVFYGTPSGTSPNRTISWTRHNDLVFNIRSNCQPSCFEVTRNGATKCISLIGKAASNNGGVDWYGISAYGVRADRPASAIIGNVAVTCNPEGGLEYSEILVPKMFSASPSHSEITWAAVPDYDEVYKYLTVGTGTDGNPIIFATGPTRIIASSDGKTWHHVLMIASTGEVECDKVLITDSGVAVLMISGWMWYIENTDQSSVSSLNIRFSGLRGYWRAPVKVSDGTTTYYVTTDVQRNSKVAVSVDGMNWIEIDSVFFGDNGGSALIGNPVVYGSDIYFPTTDGANYIRKMSLSEFFSVITLARVANGDAEFTNEEVRDRLVECITTINRIRELVNA